MSEYTTNGIPVGIGYDSNGNAKSLVELQLSLSSLENVCSDTPTPGTVLTWDGSQWCPSSTPAATASNLSSLLDTCLTGAGVPTANQSLVWNGTCWQASNVAGGGGTSLPAGDAVRNILVWNGTASWEPSAPSAIGVAISDPIPTNPGDPFTFSRPFHVPSVCATEPGNPGVYVGGTTIGTNGDITLNSAGTLNSGGTTIAGNTGSVSVNSGGTFQVCGTTIAGNTGTVSLNSGSTTIAGDTGTVSVNSGGTTIAGSTGNLSVGSSKATVIEGTNGVITINNLTGNSYLKLNGSKQVSEVALDASVEAFIENGTLSQNSIVITNSSSGASGLSGASGTIPIFSESPARPVLKTINSILNDAGISFDATGGSLALGDLTNVTLTSEAEGDFLVRGASTWENWASGTVISNLGLVVNSDLTNYVTTTELANTTLGDLSNVATTVDSGRSAGDLIVWNSVDSNYEALGSATLLSEYATTTYVNGQISNVNTSIDETNASAAALSAAIDVNTGNISTLTSDLNDHLGSSVVHFLKSDIELDDLGNVSVAGASKGDIVIYDSGWTKQGSGTLLSEYATVSYVDGEISTVNSSIANTNASAAALSAAIDINTGNISTNTGNISTNTGNIATVSGDLDTHEVASDPHTAYVLADGTRSMDTLNVTGNINVTGTVDGVDVAGHVAGTHNQHTLEHMSNVVAAVDPGAVLTWTGDGWAGIVPTTGGIKATFDGTTSSFVNKNVVAFTSGTTGYTGDGDIPQGLVLVSSTSANDATIAESTDFAIDLLRGNPSLPSEDAYALYLSGGSGDKLAAAVGGVFKTFLTKNASQMEFVGPAEVSATTPAAATGKVWFDTTTSAVKVYDGTAWVEAQFTGDVFYPSLSSLTDTDINDSETIQTGQGIVWDGTTWLNQYPDQNFLRVYNDTGSTLTVGECVVLSGALNSNVAYVGLARADSQSTMPAIGMVYADIAPGAEGAVVTYGKVNGVNTSGMTAGQKVYVSPTTAGGVTNVRPTIGGYLVQNIGVVMSVHPTNGVVKVTGIGRSNDIPNGIVTSSVADVDYLYVDDGNVFKKIAISNITSGFDHGGLAGLGDDDHTQYVLADGTRSMDTLDVTGNITVGGTVDGVDVAGHVASASVHFTEASIDHTNITNVGTNTHAQIDSHIADSTLHFTEASIDHTNITNVGTNTHAQIDSHIASASVHFTEASIDHTNITNVGTNTHAQIDSHIASASVHFTEASIDHTNITNVGTNTHAQIDSHIADSTLHFTKSSISIDDLSDVTVTSTPTGGDVLTYNSVEGYWQASAAPGGGGSTDHGALTGLSDDDHTQYVLATGARSMNTLDVTGNITVGGTVDGRDVASDGSTLDTLNSLAGVHIFDSTIHFTQASIDHGTIGGLGDNDHPQYLLTSVYSTASANIPGFQDSGLLISNAGGDSAIGTDHIPWDTLKVSYGNHASDYTYSLGTNTVTINTAGTYEVTVNVAVTTIVQRWNGILEVTKNGTAIGYGASKTGYVRAQSGHNESSMMITVPVTVSAEDTIGCKVTDEAVTGTVTTVANQSYIWIKRLD
jgi:hypothetical protein